MIVREMVKEDLDEIVSIESSLYKDVWSKEAYLRDLENEIAFNYVLEHDGVILGYYGFWLMFDNIDITKVSIRKELQGKGLSKILMEDMFNRISNSDVVTATLEVRVSNKVAISLYEKYEFKKISVREKYYENVEDAYVMQREVNQSA